jgi:hypothetical protein
MPWTINASANQPFLEVVYSGEITSTELFEPVANALTSMQSTDMHLILIDCAGVQGGHSIADLYEFANKLAQHPLRIEAKQAVVRPRHDNDDHARFWEVTSLNRGMDVRVFDDRESAIVWLLGPN